MGSADDFNELMASIDRPMLVVTTSAGDAQAGCLVGFHSQCSIEPRRYALWFSKANHTYPVAMRAEMYAAHFLSRDDHDLAELFGGLTGDDVDKFALVDWTEGPSGVPVLTRCANRFVGHRVALVDDGSDHVCVVVEPVEASSAAPFVPLRLSDAGDIDPGHDATDH